MLVAADFRHIYGQRAAVCVRGLYSQRAAVSLYTDFVRKETHELSGAAVDFGGAEENQQSADGVFSKLRQCGMSRLPVNGDGKVVAGGGYFGFPAVPFSLSGNSACGSFKCLYLSLEHGLSSRGYRTDAFTAAYLCQRDSFHGSCFKNCRGSKFYRPFFRVDHRVGAVR